MSVAQWYKRKRPGYRVEIDAIPEQTFSHPLCLLLALTIDTLSATLGSGSLRL